jgi:two-component system sensor histidine kinase BaeS
MGRHARPQRPWAHHDYHHHPWHRDWRRRRGGLFARFAGIFGCMVLLIVGAMGALAFLFSRLAGGGGQTAVLVWLVGIGLALLLPILAVSLAIQAFRGIATPLADVMSAADAVAEGDLSVRVKEPPRAADAFSRLARSFNRMVQELERADHRRREMAADVAHELRTPLHIIQGNLEGILDDVYAPTAEHIEATLEETRALARLVEDLRTLSLAEAGQLPLVLEPVDVRELLDDVVTSFSGQAEAAGIALRVETGPEDVAAGASDALAVVADVGRLDQVLGNLVANALRYTPAGGTIALRAGPLSEGAARRTKADGVRITVRDTGAGIPAEDLPYLFDRFWRGDRARARADGGHSGLGLAIARQLVQSHGGQIAVESEVGAGTTFTIDLPSAP